MNESNKVVNKLATKEFDKLQSIYNVFIKAVNDITHWPVLESTHKKGITTPGHYQLLITNPVNDKEVIEIIFSNILNNFYRASIGYKTSGIHKFHSFEFDLGEVDLIFHKILNSIYNDRFTRIKRESNSV